MPWEEGKTWIGQLGEELEFARCRLVDLYFVKMRARLQG
jgi:hypothetical protein